MTRADEPLRPRIVPERVTLELTGPEVAWLSGIFAALTDRHSRYEPTALDAQRARKCLSQMPSGGAP